jgi:hypothetical protein
MQIKKDAAVSLFVPHRASGRLVFNPKAVEALGLCPVELVERGYPVDNIDAGLAPPIETTRHR